MATHKLSCQVSCKAQSYGRLFLVFINDNRNMSSQIRLFADDLLVHHESRPQSDLQDALNRLSLCSARLVQGTIYKLAWVRRDNSTSRLQTE